MTIPSRIVFIGLFLSTIGCAQDAPVISTQEYADTWSGDSTHVLLDVRTEREWMAETGHLEGAILIPVQQLEAAPDMGDQFQGKTVIVYCRTGNRSGRATSLLRARGIDAYNMAGGITAWLQEGRPVIVEEEPAPEKQE